MRNLLRTICVNLLLLLQVPLWGHAMQASADTLRLKVLFDSGSASVVPAYKGNGKRMQSFASAYDAYARDVNYTLSSITIRTGASPDGNTKANQDLSEARTQSLLGYLSQTMSISKDYCKLLSVGEDWERLSEALGHLEQSWSGEALDIVRNTPVWVLNDEGEIVDSRKNRLKRLKDGEAWYFLLENVSPKKEVAY